MKKLTLTIVSILSVVAIFGVGFAAWVIINPGVEAPADGTIAVEEVTDKSYSLKAEFVKTADSANGTISFGAPTSGATSGWLRADSTTDKKEKLNATLTLTLTYEDWNYVPDLTLAIASVGATETTGYAKAVGENLVSNTIAIAYGTETGNVTIDGSESTAAIKRDSFTPNEDGKTATLEVTLTFAWGSFFTKGGKVVNPYEFYKDAVYDEKHTEAAEKLGNIEKYLTGISYKVTIKGTTTNA